MSRAHCFGDHQVSPTRGKLFGCGCLCLGFFCWGSLTTTVGAAPPLQSEASSSSSDVSQTVQAYLAAGEFGAATDLAMQADPGQREELLQKIVHARLADGDESAAHQALRQLGTRRNRVELETRTARSEITNGGANFTQLIQLIQNETDGPWFDVDAEGGTMTPFTSGVKVDARGILARQTADSTSRLSDLGHHSRVAAVNTEMAKHAELRLISLPRLEREVARLLENGKPVPESMRQLAGLQRVQFIFVYPEDGEVVLGGPAEGWQYDDHGMAVGIDTGRPVLQLDDLVTLLRTFDVGGRGIYGCSIDPRQENLKAVRDFVQQSQSKGPLSPAGVRAWANKIGDLLGQQKITVFGIPADSHVCRVIVEADYKMKLIGIGRLKAGPEIPDYFTLLAKDSVTSTGSLDALRWWLTLNYDGVLHSEDRMSFELRGSAVKCQSENQFLSDSGKRIPTGNAEPVNRKFAENFTAHYDQLAEHEPIFADLQGVFDLSLTAALIYGDHLDADAGWDRGVFAVDGAYRTSSYPVPQQTASVVNHRVYHGRDVVLQVAGGVRGDVLPVLGDPQIARGSPRLAKVSEDSRPHPDHDGRWWWDAR
jgi:hypothetical protein